MHYSIAILKFLHVVQVVVPIPNDYLISCRYTNYCPAGLYCPEGMDRAPDLVNNPCPTGRYCPRGDISPCPVPCVNGTYNKERGLKQV